MIWYNCSSILGTLSVYLSIDELRLVFCLNLKLSLIFNYVYFINKWCPRRVSLSLTNYQHPFSPYCNVYPTISKALTQTFSLLFYSGFTYYKMSNLDSRISNPDQLLTQVSGDYCQMKWILNCHFVVTYIEVLK